MIKFIKNILVFVVFALIIGEAISRFFHLTYDIPRRVIDSYGIQKYHPNQEGYWLGGTHKWKVNKLGWPGELPKSYDNLIMVIGDSYIENFMNPNECHQSVLLYEKNKKYNFLEAARSGVSFIEALEITKQFDSLKPINNLIYVTDSDFTESIKQIKPMSDVTQLDIVDDSIIYGKMKSPKLKQILYNWKLLFYFYNRFPLPTFNKVAKQEEKQSETADMNVDENQINKLLNYVKSHYSVNNKTLVFHPNSSKTIINLCQEIGFNTVKLNSDDDKSWIFDNDSHWTCYGHEKVANQVYSYLLRKQIVFQ